MQMNLDLNGKKGRVSELNLDSLKPKYSPKGTSTTTSKAALNLNLGALGSHGNYLTGSSTTKNINKPTQSKLAHAKHHQLLHHSHKYGKGGAPGGLSHDEYNEENNLESPPS